MDNSSDRSGATIHDRGGLRGLLDASSGGTASAIGICHSDGTKYKYFALTSEGHLIVQYNTAINIFSTLNLSLVNAFPWAPNVFLKIALDASRRTYFIGDGVDYVQVYQEANNQDFTTSQVGLCSFVGNSSGEPAAVKYLHWRI